MRDQPDWPGLSATALRALREDQASAQELTVAYRRYARKPQPRAPGLLVSRWLVAGLVMGLGIAFGADAVVQRLQSPLPASVPALPVVVPHFPPKAVPLAAPLPSRQEQDTPEAIVEPRLPVTAAPTPHAPGSANSKVSSVDGGEPPAEESAVWAKAAEGLRNNDFPETEAALATLEHAGSVTDREAARLIRAQLLMHRGDSSGARTLLQDLASNAQSAQVRAKARSLLAESSAKSNSALNVAPSGT